MLSAACLLNIEMFIYGLPSASILYHETLHVNVRCLFLI